MILASTLIQDVHSQESTPYLVSEKIKVCIFMVMVVNIEF
jgi:hypothetical protein